MRIEADTAPVRRSRRFSHVNSRALPPSLPHGLWRHDSNRSRRRHLRGSVARRAVIDWCNLIVRTAQHAGGIGRPRSQTSSDGSSIMSAAAAPFTSDSLPRVQHPMSVQPPVLRSSSGMEGDRRCPVDTWRSSASGPAVTAYRSTGSRGFKLVRASFVIAGCATALGVLSLSACSGGLATTTAAVRPTRGQVERQPPRTAATAPTTAPTRPPPTHAELVPPPPAGSGPMVWQPGHWDYTGKAGDPWTWRSGHYMPPPQDKTTWVPGWWSHSPGRTWIWVHGHWA